MIRIIDNTVDFVVIDKPIGIGMHRADDESGLVQLLSEQLQQPLWPVHRLDKMTSGLLILAKHKIAAQQFYQLFEQHQVQKFYLALSDQKPKKKQGTIKGDMAKARRGTWKLLHSQYNPAITQFFSHSLAAGLRAFLCRPISGKTHQIRVALKSLGSPVLGDKLYHTQSAAQQDRGYLHAYALQFVWQGQHMRYRCQPETGIAFQNAVLQQLLADEWAEPALLHWPKG